MGRAAVGQVLEAERGPLLTDEVWLALHRAARRDGTSEPPGTAHDTGRVYGPPKGYLPRTEPRPESRTQEPRTRGRSVPPSAVSPSVFRDDHGTGGNVRMVLIGFAGLIPAIVAALVVVVLTM
ncbi:hypothetical protein ACIOEX_31795 [Streptomyces sp. NPDC087850]|uniref:hypothetical protein n=1 Tax=Streptomyces sp. NPDC087850 TaxID=3365809 RepID=UPI0038180D27